MFARLAGSRAMALSPDWLIAGATALTAIATMLGGAASWLVYRRGLRADRPAVERVGIAPIADGMLRAEIALRNRGAEAVSGAAVEVLRPRGAGLSLTPSREGAVRGPLRFELAVARAGAEPEPPSAMMRMLAERGVPLGDRSPDRGLLAFYIAAPSPWCGGWVRLSIRIETSGAVTRQSRRTIKRFVSAAGDGS